MPTAGGLPRRSGATQKLPTAACGQTAAQHQQPFTCWRALPTRRQRPAYPTALAHMTSGKRQVTRVSYTSDHRSWRALRGRWQGAAVATCRYRCVNSRPQRLSVVFYHSLVAPVSVFNPSARPTTCREWSHSPRGRAPKAPQLATPAAQSWTKHTPAVHWLLSTVTVLRCLDLCLTNGPLRPSLLQPPAQQPYALP